MIDQRSYLKAAGEYLAQCKSMGWSVEQVLVFWEGLGGMWTLIAEKLRRSS